MNQIDYHKGIQEFTKDDFEYLKVCFKDLNSLNNVDCRKCALFYGLWWKYAYAEGKPSKEMVFKSLNRTFQSFSDEEFFQKAKEGGRKLGLKWIQRENTLFFRTLLIQGGIPLRNLQKYGTAYRNFLLKVIELRPNNISDIDNNYEVTKDLPISTRNDVVFEAALNISKAIWDDTDEGRVILDLLEQNQQRDLVDALKKHKIEIERISRSQVKIRTFWELNQTGSNDAIITLKTVLPDKIYCNSFAEMIGVNSNELSPLYSFFCDDDLHATYRKNFRGDFLKYSSDSTLRKWVPGNQHLPVLYFADASGKKYPISSQIRTLPSVSFPTLWVQMEEERWIMLPKNNHNGDSGFVLTSEPNHCIGKIQEFKLENNTFYLFEINQSTTLEISENESVSFKLNTNEFDWLIQAKHPNWIIRSNMVVVSSLPRVYFFDESGSKIQDNQIIKKWRHKGEYVWHEYFGSIPVGVIELQFCHDGVKEYDKVFNIGESVLNFIGLDILNPTINLNHNDLRIEISPNSLYNIHETKHRSISLKFVDANQMPKCIKACIKSQYGKLLVEIAMPFKGIEIVDKDDLAVPNNQIFLLNNTAGHRIVSGDNQTINVYNEQFPKLIIHQKLQSGLIPLRNYNAIIKRLFLLADSMAAGNVVNMEMQGKIIQFKAYNAILAFKNDDGSLSQSEDGRLLLNILKHGTLDFDTPQFNYFLYAVPLNCELDNIIPIELERCDDGFCIPLDVNEQEFIVFDTQTDITCKILPTYVSTNQSHLVFPLHQGVLNQKKLDRISKFANQLAEDSIDGPEWQKLNRYIQLCTQFDLAFSAFDSIRAAISSSKIAAKLYFFLICHSATNEDFIRVCEKMEEELAFRFYWCAFESIEAGFNWTTSYYGEEYLATILDKAKLVIEPKFLSFQPSEWKITEGFHLKTAINNMRGKLGESVIGELPHRRPFIIKSRKFIIQIEHENLKIMARCPITIALLKLNLYESELPDGGNAYDIWHFNNHEVRRNMMYCENLDPEWNDLAITYAFNQINKL